MDFPNPTTLILDLRDRMARIETKLDGHHDAHVVIDKAFELIGKRFDTVEAEHTALALAVAEDKGDLAISKAKLATLVTAGSAAVTFAVFVGDRLLALLHLT